MSSSAPPIIAFELGVGEFRIVTPEAVYQIKVCRGLVDASSGEDSTDDGPIPVPPVENAAPASVAPETSEIQNDPQNDFFKEISEELFDKIGRMARRLSVSVEELPSRLDMPDFDHTDQQLENAKGQLEEVVRLTEKASMTIMDTADQIQVDMDQLKNQLDILNGLDLMSPPAEGVQSAELTTQVSPASGPTPADPALLNKLDELKKIIDAWLAAPSESRPADGQAPPPEAASETETEKKTVIRFDIDVVFQTLYELCTNESVKDHIKEMREAKETAFNSQEVADRLAEMAPSAEEEDGFYSFPIPEILKTLYAATPSDDYRAILKKMNQTADGIFLDNLLPIEGESVEVEVPVKHEPPAGETQSGPSAEEASPAQADAKIQVPLDELHSLQSLALEIEKLIGQNQAADSQPEAGSENQAAPSPATLYTPILTRDRDTIVNTVGAAQELIRKTGERLTHILETLSFQDLSGQRIMRVVSMIGDIQTQLIAILVSANTKLKAHQDSGIEKAGGEAEKMAQQEVDKALEKLSGGSPLKGPGAETRLDQSAVNDLLAQLGF